MQTDDAEYLELIERRINDSPRPDLCRHLWANLTEFQAGEGDSESARLVGEMLQNPRLRWVLCHYLAQSMRQTADPITHMRHVSGQDKTVLMNSGLG